MRSTLACLLSLPVVVAAPVRAQVAPSVLFVGDLPYNDKRATYVDTTLAPAIRASDFPVLVHCGDTKGGSRPRAWYTARCRETAADVRLEPEVVVV